MKVWHVRTTVDFFPEDAYCVSLKKKIEEKSRKRKNKEKK